MWYMILEDDYTTEICTIRVFDLSIISPLMASTCKCLLWGAVYDSHTCSRGTPVAGMIWGG